MGGHEKERWGHFEAALIEAELAAAPSGSATQRQRRTTTTMIRMMGGVDRNERSRCRKQQWWQGRSPGWNAATGQRLNTTSPKSRDNNGGSMMSEAWPRLVDAFRPLLGLWPLSTTPAAAYLGWCTPSLVVIYGRRAGIVARSRVLRRRGQCDGGREESDQCNQPQHAHAPPRCGDHRGRRGDAEVMGRCGRGERRKNKWADGSKPRSKGKVISTAVTACASLCVVTNLTDLPRARSRRLRRPGAKGRVASW